MVGISFSRGLFSGAMLVSGRVYFDGCIFDDCGNYHTVILQSKKTGMELSHLHL